MVVFSTFSVSSTKTTNKSLYFTPTQQNIPTLLYYNATKSNRKQANHWIKGTNKGTCHQGTCQEACRKDKR